MFTYQPPGTGILGADKDTVNEHVVKIVGEVKRWLVAGVWPIDGRLDTTDSDLPYLGGTSGKFEPVVFIPRWEEELACHPLSNVDSAVRKLLKHVEEIHAEVCALFKPPDSVPASVPAPTLTLTLACAPTRASAAGQSFAPQLSSGGKKRAAKGKHPAKGKHKAMDAGEDKDAKKKKKTKKDLYSPSLEKEPFTALTPCPQNMLLFLHCSLAATSYPGPHHIPANPEHAEARLVVLTMLDKFADHRLSYRQFVPSFLHTWLPGKDVAISTAYGGAAQPSQHKNTQYNTEHYWAATGLAEHTSWLLNRPLGAALPNFESVLTVFSMTSPKMDNIGEKKVSDNYPKDLTFLCPTRYIRRVPTVYTELAMPKQAGHVLKRIANFTKKTIERFSPRKKRKTEGKENASPQSSPPASVFSVDPIQHNILDVFLSSPASDLSPSAPQTGFFYHTSPLVPPERTHAQSYHKFSLLPPRRKRASVEEVLDEDVISMMTRHSNASDTSIDNEDLEAELRAEMEHESREHQAPPGTSPPPNIVPQIHAESSLPDGKLREAPTVEAALAALKDLCELLRPHRKTGRGYKLSAIDPFICIRMENMEIMLNLYTRDLSNTKGFWAAFVLPINPYGYWNTSMLVDEPLQADINLYLQELGKDITAEKLVEYLGRPETLGYRWMSPKKGQYADGHERPDVVDYQQNKFLPGWASIQERMDAWSKENLPFYGPHLPGKHIVVWFHDESIFYAHDCRRKTWYHKNVPAKPYAKGEGASLMIANFVSSKYGWLRSPDEMRDVRVIMSPGKNKDGYFTNVEIREQAQAAMDLLNEFYPDEEHFFVYDNATTHLKRPEGSLSATKMTKGLSANFLVEVNLRDEHGAQVYSSTGAYIKTKIRMADTTFQGQPQHLYFPDGHALAGLRRNIRLRLNPLRTILDAQPSASEGTMTRQLYALGGQYSLHNRLQFEGTMIRQLYALIGQYLVHNRLQPRGQ
ncbi:hypothetical protein DFH09DRAFT_1097822 [Mycena vulgaris]|nr:hypothetical protein DFH09DRAFT_1097822 [Mycena vulgaris]